MKQYSFFFHYNKPASKAAGKPIISLHYKKTCYPVENIICHVHTFGKISKRQPYFVMAGKCSRVDICGKIALIN